MSKRIIISMNLQNQNDLHFGTYILERKEYYMYSFNLHFLSFRFGSRVCLTLLTIY
jgi:hypothetical protein